MGTWDSLIGINVAKKPGYNVESPVSISAGSTPSKTVVSCKSIEHWRESHNSLELIGKVWHVE